MIPENASCTSATIQNETMGIKKDIVTENVVNDTKEAGIPFFSIKSDETCGPTNTKYLSSCKMCKRW